MFLAGGCSSCHMTPKQKDATRLGGGLRLNTAFGEFYVPNISPDTKDGIGAWREADFVTAMTKGDVAGRLASLSGLSLSVLRAHAHRGCARPVRVSQDAAAGRRDAPRRTRSNFRSTSAAPSASGSCFLRRSAFVPDPKQSAEWNRGAYLVNAPGHCAECHSPRNLLGAVVVRRRFDGGPSPTDQGGVPSIRQDKLGAWTVEDFVAYPDDGRHARLRPCRRPDGRRRAQHRAAFRRRPARHGGLYQVAAAPEVTGAETKSPRACRARGLPPAHCGALTRRR